MLDELKDFLWKYMYWIFAIIVIAIASQSFIIINDGFIGIQRTFGQIHDRVLTAGINIKTPFTIVKEMRIADSTISYDGSAIADTINQMHEPLFRVYNKTDSTSGSGTTIEVELRPTIVYSLNSNTAPQLIRTMGANWQMTYMRQVMQDALQKATADLDLSSPHVTVESLKSKIESLLVKLFNERGDYVKLVNVNIDYTLPKEVIEAGVAIYQSRQGLIRANAEQEKVRVELQTAWNVAENNAKIAAMKVTAPINSVVQYFVSLGFSNEESVEKALQLLQLQTWNGQLPMFMGNSDTSPPVAPIFSYPLRQENQLDK